MKTNSQHPSESVAPRGSSSRPPPGDGSKGTSQYPARIVSGTTEDGRLIVAGVSYLNARPILDPLEREPYRQRFVVERAIPSEVARRVAEDEAALGLLPVAAAASLGDIRFVRGIGIGARGPVRSVLLVSECPIPQVETVELDLSSRTSVVLVRLLLAWLCDREPHYVGRTYTAERGPTAKGKTASLLIGDAALAIEGRYPYALDLGQAWLAWTGLPFVFAAFGARAGTRVTATDQHALQRALAEGLRERPAIAVEHAERTGIDRTTAHAYLTEAIQYDFGDEERRGLELFYAKAAAAGLLPKANIRFADDPEPVRRPSVDSLLERAAGGERVSGDDAMRLAEEASLFDLGVAADAVRRRKHPEDVVTYIVDRNVNYTNVCTTSCRFCAFYRPVGHPEGYVLSREELGKKLQEVVDAGGVQILLQGGLNPDLPITWYEDLFRWMKAEYKLGLHALSPEEIWHISRLENLPIDDRARAPARGGARFGAGGRRRDTRRPRTPQDRQGQVHERHVARSHARRAPDGPSVERHHDVRHRRQRLRPRAAPAQAARPARRDARLHRFFLLGLPARARHPHPGRAKRGRASTCARRRSPASCSTISITSALRG